MLIHADVKGLEVVTAAYLSNDEVLKSEVRNGVDIHSENQKRFNLPDRVIAKIFKFRLIYGGSAYSYANDADFAEVSTSQKYWQNIIDEYYLKYKGMKAWHEQLVNEVLTTGQLVMPTGRVFTFPRSEVATKLYSWRSKILNYPVQGTGADLVSIGRATLWKRLKRSNLKYLLQSTVHDSIDIDTNDKAWYNICEIIKNSIEDIPKNFDLLFNKPFDLPITCEIGYGPNLENLTKYESNHNPKS